MFFCRTVAGRFHFFTYIHIIIIACYNQKLRNKLKNRKAFLFKSLNQSVQPKYYHKLLIRHRLIF